MTTVKAQNGIPFWGLPGAEDLTVSGYAPTSPWDFITIAGQRLPVASVKGKLEQRNEKRTTPGKSGSSTTLHGFDSWEGTIQFRLWTQDQLTVYERVKDLVLPADAKGPPPPVDVYHPNLQALKTTKILVLELGDFDIKRGIATVQWKARGFGGSVRNNSGGKLSTPKASKNTLESLAPGAVVRAIDNLPPPQTKPSVTQSKP